MRDHFFHGVEMPAGTWGAKLGQTKAGGTDTRKEFQRAFRNAMKDRLFYDSHPIVDTADQRILIKYECFQGCCSDSFVVNVFRYVYPFAKKTLMAHDSFHCVSFPDGTRGFPTRREIGKPDNFIGSIVGENMTLEMKCPNSCRRNEEWEYC